MLIDIQFRIVLEHLKRKEVKSPGAGGQDPGAQEGGDVLRKKVPDASCCLLLRAQEENEAAQVLTRRDARASTRRQRQCWTWALEPHGNRDGYAAA